MKHVWEVRITIPAKAETRSRTLHEMGCLWLVAKAKTLFQPVRKST